MEQRGKRSKPHEEGPIGRGERTDKERPEWQTRVHRVKSEEKSPLIPSAVTSEDLDFSVRVQLKTLTAENAEMVARHLAIASPRSYPEYSLLISFFSILLTLGAPRS